MTETSPRSTTPWLIYTSLSFLTLATTETGNELVRELERIVQLCRVLNWSQSFWIHELLKLLAAVFVSWTCVDNERLPVALTHGGFSVSPMNRWTFPLGLSQSASAEREREREADIS